MRALKADTQRALQPEAQVHREVNKTEALVPHLPGPFSTTGWGGGTNYVGI